LFNGGGKLVGTGAAGNAQQGYSVALSGYGNTAIVGGISDSTGAGAAWVYTQRGGGWIQQGNKLVAGDAVGMPNKALPFHFHPTEIRRSWVDLLTTPV
jgi:hypothetical protein